MSIRRRNLQSGQTLIETLVAVFILVMGISAALGLANYSLGATSTIRKQIIAMGLAREGIEAVKNMRDTNWLNANLSNDCHDFLTGSATAYCYRYWLDPGAEGQNGYGLDAGAFPAYYALTYDLNAPEHAHWRLDYRAGNSDYGLNYDQAAAPQHGLYSSWVPTSFAQATSDYARRITIDQATDEPFDSPGSGGTGQRLKITSEVWWKDKTCPTPEQPPTDDKCVIKLETYLTNWKDY